ncbi:hypothetical protein EDB85DRAFT_758347 [Lactarius pseudohatsudake]|nr:hypothetical protein EDB85DRAFT_758347 [Lactarius pseudohatsudake]
MSSSEIPRKGVAQGGRPLKRQPTGVPIPAGQTGSRPKKTTARRKLHKERSMRIPAIENDLMNRIGVSKKRKAIARAASTKSTSPYKNLLVGIARTEDPTSDAEDTSNPLVRCESPSPTSPSHTRSASPQPSELPATATGAAEAKGKKRRITGQSSIVLRPLPSRVAASSSHCAGSPTVHPLSRTPQDLTTARPSGTASSSPRSGSFSPRKRSPLAVALPIENFPSVPVPVAAIPDDSAGSTARVQGEGARVDSSEESDSQSEDLSISDVTSHESERSVPDISAANVTQAAAMKRSLLCQIEGRNEGGKWDDLQGFLHSLAPSEICGLLKTATRAGRRALRRLAGKEMADSDNRNEEDDARILGRAQGESVLPPDDAGSDGEEVVTVPPRRRRFLYKAKGKARARSPSPPPLPSSPSPVFVSQTGAAASSSNCLVTRKRSRTPESASSGDDDTPTKRQKREPGNNKPRPLRREGAFLHYSAPPPLPAEDTDQRRQTAHVNLVKSFLDQVQDLDVSGWLSRGSGITPPNCDPFVAARDDDDDDDDDDWALRAELHGARRRHRGARVDDDDATRRPSLYAVSRT